MVPVGVKHGRSRYRDSVPERHVASPLEMYLNALEAVSCRYSVFRQSRLGLCCDTVFKTRENLAHAHLGFALQLARRCALVAH
jgi:hypothetical protein